MRKIAVIILVVVMLMAVPSFALAQEPSRYNFASAQGNKQMQVILGDEGTGIIYFYNIDGNRITHVTLEVSKAPDNWQVEIQPPSTEIQVEMDGRKVTVTENLHVEPSEVLPQEAVDIPSGMVCISVPNRGYALAKVAKVIIRVPESEEIGTKGEINISAIAEWLGQTGAAAVKQGRDFDFSVEAVSGATRGEEKILEEIGTTGVASETAGSEVEMTKGASIAEIASETAGSEAEMMEEDGTAEVVSETTGDEVKMTKGASIAEIASETAGSEAEMMEEDGTAEVEKPSSIVERWLPVIIAAVIVISGAVSIPLLVRRRHEKG